MICSGTGNRTRLIEAGSIKVTLDGGKHSQATAADAHQALADGATQGKMVIAI